MAIFYNFLIFLLRTGFRIGSLFNAKAAAFVAGQKDIFQQLESRFKGNKSRVVWIHCASLGEFEQGRPVMESIKKDFPDINYPRFFHHPGMK